MKKSLNPKPVNPIIVLIITVVLSILLFIWTFFIMDGIAYKACAVIVSPALIIYGFYAYFKEKKADAIAIQKHSDIVDGSYFQSMEWKTKYTTYRMEHPFERPQGKSMKADLLRRYRSRESVFGMILGGFILALSVIALIYYFQFILILGLLLGGWFFISYLNDFTGKPVRRWLKKDIDYLKLEQSYMRGKMVTFKSNGINLGATHIHAFTHKKVYSVDYQLAQDITRKIVRLKKYEDSIFSGEEYQHFAVIHVRLPQSNDNVKIEIELNEYQVEMVLQEFSKIKYKAAFHSETDYSEDYDNDVTV